MSNRTSITEKQMIGRIALKDSFDQFLSDPTDLRYADLTNAMSAYIDANKPVLRTAKEMSHDELSLFAQSVVEVVQSEHGNNIDKVEELRKLINEHCIKDAYNNNDK